MKYFNKIETLEELKREYKKLVLKLHPDVNQEKDTTKEFQEMQKEYKIAFEKVKNYHKDADGKVYEKESDETPEEFKEIIDKIILFRGCSIEIIGNWIWVSGNTKEYKEQLKNLNFNWCKNKFSWCYHKDKFVRKYKKHYTMDQLRDKFGSQRIMQDNNYIEV